MPHKKFAVYLQTYFDTETTDRQESIAKSIQRYAQNQTPGNARRIFNGYTTEYDGLNALYARITDCPADQVTPEFLADIYQKMLLQGYADLFDETGEIHQEIQQLFLKANIAADTIKSPAFKQALLSGYVTNFLPSNALEAKQKEIFAQEIAHGNVDAFGNVEDLDRIIVPISIFNNIMAQGENTALPQLFSYSPAIVLTAEKLQLFPDAFITNLDSNKMLQGSLKRLLNEPTNSKYTLDLLTATQMWLDDHKSNHKDYYPISTLHNHLERQILQIKNNKDVRNQLINSLFNLQHYTQTTTKEAHDAASNINALFRNALNLNDPYHTRTLKALTNDELIHLFQAVRDAAKDSKKDDILKALAKTSLLAEKTISSKTYSLEGLAKEIPPAAGSPVLQTSSRHRSNALSSYIASSEPVAVSNDVPSSSNISSSSSIPSSSEASSSNSWTAYRPSRH